VGPREEFLEAYATCDWQILDKHLKPGTTELTSEATNWLLDSWELEDLVTVPSPVPKANPNARYIGGVDV